MSLQKTNALENKKVFGVKVNILVVTIRGKMFLSFEDLKNFDFLNYRIIIEHSDFEKSSFCSDTDALKKIIEENKSAKLITVWCS